MSSLRKPIRLRTQISILMIFLVLLQSLSLVLALSVSKVFFLLDAESFRLFGNTAQARVQTFNTEIGQLVENTSKETEHLNQQIKTLAQNAQVNPADIYVNDRLYDETSLIATQSLVGLLQNNNVTGAFFILNGSNSDISDTNAHSAIYLRNSAPDNVSGDASSYLLEIGPTLVSQTYTFATSINWKLDMQFSDRGVFDFYDEPLKAAAEYPGSELLRYGYWSAPQALLNDNQRAITYTLPLRDENGAGYGVVGIDISLSHFAQHYLPNVDLPYESSFYAISRVIDDEIALDWVIPSGPLAQVYLEQGKALELTKVEGVDLYETNLEGLGKTYCSIQPLTLYSKNSPFFDETWSLMGFVPKDILHESSAGVQSTLVTSIALTTLAAFVAIFVLAYVSTRKITDLLKYVDSVSPYHSIEFKKTGMREIDELTSAVTMLNDSVINASKTTAKILELTLLPIGVYEITSDNNTVILTEYVYQQLGLKPGSLVSKSAWEDYFKTLTANPVKGFDNVYRHEDPETKNILHLRILEHQTDTGLIGVVLDVTKDIEENQRLAHQLDYDALTQLYSRIAFKREAYTKIQEQPDKIGAMIFSDLDNLKYINDTFGHDVGDRMIIKAGEMFREFTVKGGLVSRISGDEFAVYLHGFTSKEEALALIREQFERFKSYNLTTPTGDKHRIRCSSGIAWYPHDSDNVTDLLKLSDYAMYEAKNKVKGTVFEFDKSSYRENAYLLENREAINRLLDEKLIKFAFQPIIDVRTGKVFAYEALMRPLLEDFKSPLEILAVAAAQSKLGPLERLVTLSVFEVIAERSNEFGDAKIFMNSIPSQILSDEDHMYIKRHFSDHFSQVVVEVTEEENNSPEMMITKTSFIRGCGMQVAIDDFGSGYSNEVRILSMNPDIVKIDRGLVAGICYSADKQRLVSNLVSFAHSKGILVIAEGVENAEDLGCLVHLEIDYVQGYYTGRPSFDFEDINEQAQEKLQEIIRNR